MDRLNFTRCDIEKVVALFYARVRVHPVLGPVFQAKIPNNDDAWQAHEAKIVEFWSSAILKTRTFQGNPMQAHRGVAGLKAEHFDIWLGMFDAVLSEVLPRETARLWSQMAHNIGRGLRMGLAQNPRDGQAPVLAN